MASPQHLRCVLCDAVSPLRQYMCRPSRKGSASCTCNLYALSVHLCLSSVFVLFRCVSPASGNWYVPVRVGEGQGQGQG